MPDLVANLAGALLAGARAALPLQRIVDAPAAAREVGGREMVRIPFQWPPKAAATGQAKGETELGAVSLSLKP